MELYRLFFQSSLTLVLYGWELQLKWHFLLPVRMGRGWAYGFKTHRICVIHHLNKSEHPRRDAMLLWLLLGIIVLCWRNNCVNCFFPYWVLLLEDVWLVVVGTWDAESLVSLHTLGFLTFLESLLDVLYC